MEEERDDLVRIQPQAVLKTGNQIATERIELTVLIFRQMGSRRNRLKRYQYVQRRILHQLRHHRRLRG